MKRSLSTSRQLRTCSRSDTVDNERRNPVQECLGAKSTEWQLDLRCRSSIRTRPVMTFWARERWTSTSRCVDLSSQTVLICVCDIISWLQDLGADKPLEFDMVKEGKVRPSCNACSLCSCLFFAYKSSIAQRLAWEKDDGDFVAYKHLFIAVSSTVYACTHEVIRLSCEPVKTLGWWHTRS